MKDHLEALDIAYRFPGALSPVLNDISISIRAGEFVPIVGPSGCGKTTLLRILHGLVAPSSGQIVVNSEDVTGVVSDDRGIVFQGDRLFPWRTVLENVRFGLDVARVPRERANQISRQAVKLVRLSQNLSAYPHELSGGMRQRVNVARALTLRPRFLLMDEPFSALDAQTRELMQSELLEVWQQTDSGVVFITHQIEEAVYLGDRVIVMGSDPGRITKEIRIPFGRPRDLTIKRSPKFQDICQEIWTEIESDVLAEFLKNEENT